MLEEVGAYTLHRGEIRNLMVDSPDGYIRVDHKPNLPNCCHSDVWGFNNLDMTLEIKCPFPDPKICQCIIPFLSTIFYKFLLT